MRRLKSILGLVGIAAGLGQFSGIALAAPPGAPVVTLTGNQTVTVCNDPKQATDLVITANATNLGGKAAAFSWATDIPGINITAQTKRTPTATGQVLTIPAAAIQQALASASVNMASVSAFRVRLFVANYQNLTSDMVEFAFKVERCQLKR